jgi:catalase
MASIDTDYHIRDLYEHIGSGEFPSWSLKVQVMPYEDAKNYRFNPFDLTKVWPHGDYPLIDVGTMTLNRNPENYHTDIEVAAFEPSNLVPGVGVSPDKMLLGRIFSYPDTHRYRIGPNYMQLPVNAPKSPVHSYSKDGPMRYQNAGDPVYAPNSYGGPAADTARFGEAAGWEASSSEMARSAYVQHAEDDDWTQPGTMVREVLDDAARERLVNNIVGHLLNAVSEPVLQRAFEYWRNVDKNLGDKVEVGVRAKQSEKDPKAAEQANPAREGAQAKA